MLSFSIETMECHNLVDMAETLNNNNMIPAHFVMLSGCLFPSLEYSVKDNHTL